MVDIFAKSLIKLDLVCLLVTYGLVMEDVWFDLLTNSYDLKSIRV